MNIWRNPKRPGFTLIELLVVIAIIGVLMALLLPAIQKVREAANKMKCGNNLHQLGIAWHNFEGAAKYLPGSSWPRQLLPFLEQEAVYNQSYYARGGLITFTCPSRNDPASGIVDYTGGSMSNSAMKARKLRDIVNGDGTSNTILFGEKSQAGKAGRNYGYVGDTSKRDYYYWYISSGASNYVTSYDYGTSPYRDTAYPDGSITNNSSVTLTVPCSYWGYRSRKCRQIWYKRHTNRNPYWYAYLYNYKDPSVPVSHTFTSTGTRGFGSAHTGSMNVLMCDGSVRQFKYGATGLTALLTYDDGKNVTLPE